MLILDNRLLIHVTYRDTVYRIVSYNTIMFYITLTSCKCNEIIG